MADKLAIDLSKAIKLCDHCLFQESKCQLMKTKLEALSQMPPDKIKSAADIVQNVLAFLITYDSRSKKKTREVMTSFFRGTRRRLLHNSIRKLNIVLGHDANVKQEEDKDQEEILNQAQVLRTMVESDVDNKESALSTSILTSEIAAGDAFISYLDDDDALSRLLDSKCVLMSELSSVIKMTVPGSDVRIYKAKLSGVNVVVYMSPNAVSSVTSRVAFLRNMQKVTAIKSPCIQPMRAFLCESNYLGTIYDANLKTLASLPKVSQPDCALPVLMALNVLHSHGVVHGNISSTTVCIEESHRVVLSGVMPHGATMTDDANAAVALVSYLLQGHRTQQTIKSFSESPDRSSLPTVFLANMTFALYYEYTLEVDTDDEAAASFRIAKRVAPEVKAVKATPAAVQQTTTAQPQPQPQPQPSKPETVAPPPPTAPAVAPKPDRLSTVHKAQDSEPAKKTQIETAKVQEVPKTKLAEKTGQEVQPTTAQTIEAPAAQPAPKSKQTVQPKGKQAAEGTKTPKTVPQGRPSVPVPRAMPDDDKIRRDNEHLELFKSLFSCSESASVAYQTLLNTVNTGSSAATKSVQFLLGLCYYVPLGVVSYDMHEAKFHIHRAYKRGHYGATVSMSMFTKYGLCECGKNRALSDRFRVESESDALKILPLEERFVKYLREAALGSDNAHVGPAKYALGVCHMYGFGVRQDFKIAIDYFTSAHAIRVGKHRSATCLALGHCYDYGIGVEPDATKAFSLYKQAAYDCTSAMVSLGDAYKTGIGTTRVSPLEAFRHYLKGAGLNDANALYHVGDCYANAVGTTQDYAKAFDYYMKAAALGSVDAMNNIGALYENGDGVKKDGKKAFGWYREAAIKNDACAQFNVADCYYKGVGVEKNVNEAVKYYKLSAGDINGDTQAQVRIGQIYLSGECDSSVLTLEETVELLGRAVANDDVEASYMLGCVYERTKASKDAVACYTKAADREHPLACRRLGQMYKTGLGVRENLVKAKEYFDAGAKLGDQQCKQALAEMSGPKKRAAAGDHEHVTETKKKRA